METLHFSCAFERFASRSELPTAFHELIARCSDAKNNAYAPYSNFHVGAAVLLENGTIITGNNQENAAYPSGLCAERVAFFSAGSLQPDVRILAAAVTASSAQYVQGAPVSPCGACRQSMLEYELKQNTDIPLLMVSPSGEIIVAPSIKSLLPLYFESRGKF